MHNYWTPIVRVGLQRLADVGEHGEGVAGYPVIGPAGVVKLLHLTMTCGTFQLKFKKNVIFSFCCPNFNIFYADLNNRLVWIMSGRQMVHISDH